MMGAILIQGGRLVDPATGRDEVADLFIRDGRIVSLPAVPPPDAACLDARGLVVVPGLIDLHVHLREPGGEESETIETGSRAAAHGGFTSIVAMPNTKPALDTPELMEFVRRRGAAAALVRVLPAGCVTADRQGERLSDLAALAAAGAVAFTDDGSVVACAALLQRALIEARRLGRPVMEHAEDHKLEQAGVMHAGEFSRQWKLPGIPAAAETRLVGRDIELAAATGAAVHIQHVSAAESVRLIRAARARGVRVTGELTPHHLALTDAEVRPDDANFKMNPPLRSAADRAALLAGLADGTLTCLATDHAPHTAAAKARGFLHAPSGVVGLETAVGVTYTELVHAGRMEVLTWLRCWTTGPAEVLGLPPPSLAEGAVADLALLDLDTEWTVQPEEFAGKSRNTPFAGRRLTGRAAGTLLGGAVVWLADARRLKDP